MSTAAEVGADVDWPDADAAAAARAAAPVAAGRLGELLEWAAGTQGRFPPVRLRRVRCLLDDDPVDALAELAVELDVGLRRIRPPAQVAAGFAAGVALADEEIDSGADLLVLAAPGDAVAAALAVGAVTGAEPVALLPRGASAVDTAGWIARAAELRDGRRRLAGLGAQPDELLSALGSPAFALLAGVALRAAVRRTPAVLDGTAAVAAGVVGSAVQTRVVRWWQVADTSTDPVHERASAQLGRTPLLALSAARGDGTAGLLAVAVLRAAIGLAA